MQKLFKLAITIFTILLSGCTGKETDNPEKVFKYWSGSSAPKDVQLINGTYWESPHWTKEYEMYLELKAPKRWINDFFNANNTPSDSDTLVIPEDAPTWFKPDKSFRMKGTGHGSTYYIDHPNGHLFIYEIQL